VAVEASDLARAFERAPALVDRLLAEAPFPTPDAAIARARTLLEAMSERDRIAVLDAHPRIGAAKATLSPDSLKEQGGDEDPAVLERLAALNDEYERAFGFRFVIFMHGRTKREAIPLMEQRLRGARERELATALDEFLAIARDRLSA
jgi:2-oxo-4-hydroxy-4-carboxy--5-ureidoimidazoline (OHCU) decarboxylase